MPATTALCEALNQGISSGNFVDTKIILYSHKDPSGRICRPKALYSNSHVLKTVPYFKDLLFGDFAESQPKEFKDPTNEQECAEHYGYLSDSDLEDDEDGEVPTFNHTTESKANRLIPPVVSVDGRVVCEDQMERPEKGKVVEIPDMAFVTFQAFLMYLYTGVIEFAPFGSELRRRSRSAEIVDRSDDKVPRPSPKSIYRLADKYDVPALRDLALHHIRGELANCDIVGESFSSFASRHDEIRNLYVEQLAYVWMEDSTTEKTRTSVEEKVCSFVQGDLDHAMETLSALWEIASKDEDVEAPSNVTVATSQPASPTHWTLVKRALIKSIRRGVFFDQMHWARHFKSGDVLRPVYFSSVITNEKAQQLNSLVKYLKGQNPFIGDPEGDVNVESDCEGDSLGLEGESPKTKEEKAEKTRAVLTTGSHSAWKSLFFYLCTDTILFAPLRSQGVESRSNYIRGNLVAAPPPCSPKSIYILAALLGIQPLCDSALADIRSKMTPDNIVGEIFSYITAGQKEVMEMQCDLLVSNFKNLKTIALVKEKIRRIPDVSLSHCAGGLNLVLRKAFELKKGKRQERIKWATSYCRWCHDSTPYSVVGTCACCLGCNNYLRSSDCGCGRQRTGGYSSCKSCEGFV